MNHAIGLLFERGRHGSTRRVTAQRWRRHATRCTRRRRSCRGGHHTRPAQGRDADGGRRLAHGRHASRQLGVAIGQCIGGNRGRQTRDARTTRISDGAGQLDIGQVIVQYVGGTEAEQILL